MRIACLIIGIDNWEKYTLPLVESIKQHEPAAKIIVIDNESKNPYPNLDYVYRIKRACYSKAINHAKELVPDADYYIVLSNDVLCTGSFSRYLNDYSVIGVELVKEHGLQWLMGWCVAIPSKLWAFLGNWDENYQISSWEDVDYSTRVLKSGFDLVANPSFPFKHLDQKQRFTIVENYWLSEIHNRDYFFKKFKL